MLVVCMSSKMQVHLASCAGDRFWVWPSMTVAANQKNTARVVVVLTRWSLVRVGAVDFGHHQHPRPNHNPGLRKSWC
jgi:hypothetical protein